METPKYEIRTLTRKELDISIEWAAVEGWNPGLYDAESFFAADPTGFLMGFLDGKPIATISVVKYGNLFGFLGLYIVAPEYRGKSYGIKIWNEGMKYLEGRNIGLDGVVAQQENYKKSGFKLAYRNIRFEGISGGNDDNKNIINASSLPFDLLEKFDRKFFPEERSEFLKAWLSQPESFSLAYQQNQSIDGLGMIRKCRNGYKIGPLYADNSIIAEELFIALKSKVLPNEPIFLDVPEINKEAVALAEKYDMKLSFETARMYTGDFPVIPIEKIFGVTTFELG